MHAIATFIRALIATFIGVWSVDATVNTAWPFTYHNVIPACAGMTISEDVCNGLRKDQGRQLDAAPVTFLPG